MLALPPNLIILPLPATPPPPPQGNPFPELGIRHSYAYFIMYGTFLLSTYPMYSNDLHLFSFV